MNETVVLWGELTVNCADAESAKIVARLRDSESEQRNGWANMHEELTRTRVHNESLVKDLNVMAEYIRDLESALKVPKSKHADGAKQAIDRERLRITALDNAEELRTIEGKIEGLKSRAKHLSKVSTPGDLKCWEVATGQRRP